MYVSVCIIDINMVSRFPELFAITYLALDLTCVHCPGKLVDEVRRPRLYIPELMPSNSLAPKKQPVKCQTANSKCKDSK